MGGRRARLVYSCDEDFDRMPRVAGGQHCARCDRVIVDLRDVTQRELEALASAGGAICGRVRTDEHGVVLVREPPLVPIRRRAAAALVATTLAACEASGDPTAPAAIEARAPATSEAAPAPDLGPPMLPVEQMHDGGAPDTGPAPCASAEDPALGLEDATPTPDQRARTRRKRRGRGGPAGPPPHHHGGVIMMDF